MALVGVIVADGRWRLVRGARKIAAGAVSAALAASGVALLPQAEAAVLLTDDAALAALNQQWRGKASATNVLSFPAVSGHALAQSPMIGDIALAYETCAREAKTEGKTLRAHLTHLAVHGALHLVGYDHETEQDADVMETLERSVLAGLGIADPYAEVLGTKAKR